MEQAANNNYDCDGSDDDEAPDLIEIGDAAIQLPTTNDDIPQSPCPVTILSGFLGSGKTTLIQYILKSQDHGKRIAVIENEFGEGLAIESLIARDGLEDSNTLQDLIELPNGCVCCTVKDSLVETLELLLDKRQDLDYILIEASGMADPGPIASVFWLDEALESRLKLDGIVTLVDGKHVLKQLEQTEEAARQIAYADRIVLNKVDLLSKTKGETNNKSSIHEVESALRVIHPTAPILKTSFSEIPNLEWILDADCFGGQENLEQIQSGFQQEEPKTAHNHHGHDHEHDENCAECCHGESITDDDDDDHHHHHGHDHDEHDHETHKHHNNSHDDHHHGHHEHEKHDHKHRHKHTASITTLSLDSPGSVDVKKINAWLADILWPNQDETDTVLSAMLRKQEQGEINNNEVKPDGHASGKSSSTQQQIFRIKGICSVVASDDYEMEVDMNANPTGLDPRRFIVQAVHDLWDIQPVTSKALFWDTNEKRNCKLVVIGKNLQHQDLKEGFERCLVQE